MNARPDTREFEYWTPEPLFVGETVFCLASGPSLTPEIGDRLIERTLCVVNSSWRFAPYADMLFFTDSGWYEPRRAIVRKFPGLVVSMSRTAKRELPDKVLRVQGEGDPAFPVASFPPAGAPVIRQGRSSGHSAVSALVAMSAATVVLVGFDMRMVDGREHCHSEYSGARDLDIYAREFVPGFAGWNAAALARGTRILNATPGSAVTEFPLVDLDEML